jgi:hypothetical protein
VGREEEIQMRKALIDTTATTTTQSSTGAWLDLDAIATVEITSEDPHFPIEHALGAPPTAGWRAAAKGPQFIRLNFDHPTAIHRIHLHFADLAAERSQEFAIYARSGDGEMRELRRQQFTFSPGGSSEEIEDYTVDLPAVATLELRIDPDRAHDPTHSQHYAVLKSLRLA